MNKKLDKVRLHTLRISIYCAWCNVEQVRMTRSPVIVNVRVVLGIVMFVERGVLGEVGSRTDSDMDVTDCFLSAL